MTHVVVPKADLEKVEESRKGLYELLHEQCKDTNFLIKLNQLTAPLWSVANTNHPVSKCLK